MTSEQLQERCEIGQRQLMEMRYLDAIETLASAETVAWAAGDFDTLARLYMPLQEARRQARQRCGEGLVQLDLMAPAEGFDAGALLDERPHGQLVVAGWGSVWPAVEVRRVARERKVYIETFLAAAYPIVGGETAVVIVPTEDVRLPEPAVRTIDGLLRLLPAHCLIFGPTELPRGARRGSTETFGMVMGMWERLHQPFLAMADSMPDAIGRMEGYRRTILVDSACELAHQKLSDAARRMSRRGAEEAR